MSDEPGRRWLRSSVMIRERLRESGRRISEHMPRTCVDNERRRHDKAYRAEGHMYRITGCAWVLGQGRLGMRRHIHAGHIMMHSGRDRLLHRSAHGAARQCGHRTEEQPAYKHRCDGEDAHGRNVGEWPSETKALTMILKLGCFSITALPSSPFALAAPLPIR
jgi:hypothetical protein